MNVDERNAFVLGMMRLYYWLANRYVQRPQDREDAVQSAVLHLLALAHEYDPAKEKPERWACRIARRAFNQMARRARYQEFPGLLFDPTDKSQRRPDEIIYDKELCDRVNARLNELSWYTSDMIRRNVIGYKVSIRRIAFLMRMPEEYDPEQQNGGAKLAGGLGPSASKPVWKGPFRAGRLPRVVRANDAAALARANAETLARAKRLV